MSFNNIEITTANKADLKLLSKLCSKTFLETYAKRNTKENIEKYVKEYFTKGKLSLELKDPKSIFLMVFNNNKAIGYAKLRTGKNPKELKGKKAIEIERMYLLKRFMGKGIGKLLMKKCLEIAKKKNYKILWLGVWEYNTSAISFYKKFGYEIRGHPL